MRRRSGFTLVELLVSLALILFIMAILSEAFVQGLESFRKLRAMAELEQGMRTLEAILRRDLAANHFEGDKRLSESTVSGLRVPMFDYGKQVTIADLAPYQLKPPDLGFFSVREGVFQAGGNAALPYSVPGLYTNLTNGISQFEGADSLGVGKASAMDTNDSLHFTVRLNGNKREMFFSGRVWPGSLLDTTAGSEDSRFQTPGAATYSSQWAEVVYFLAPGEFRPPGGPMLFNLYRRQLLLLPDAFTVYNPNTNPPTTIAPTFPNSEATVGGGPQFVNNLVDYHRNYDMSAYYNGTNFFFNTPADVQFRQRRYAHHPTSGLPPANAVYPPVNTSYSMPWPWAYPTLTDFVGPTDARAGADLLLANVISFDVKILDPLPTNSAPSNANLTGPQDNPPNAATNPNRFVDLGFGRRLWDPSLNGGLGGWSNIGPFVGPGNSTVPGPGIPRAIDLTGGYVFDTWSTRNNGSWNYALVPTPYPIPFSAIQVKVRVWDRKTNQTRELTIIQDM
jgi:prepilin-type N-terminal cleavage/methylation domain-containing protein